MAIDTLIWRPDNSRLFWCICCLQVLLIAVPFVIHDLMATLLVLVIVSIAALVGSITTATFYLCFVSAVVPTWLYHDYLTLPLDFRFYEGLFAVVVLLAGLSWLLDGRLNWPRRTILDRFMLLLLGAILFSCLLGFLYGQAPSQILRDVRYPLYYTFFFAVTWFFDLRKISSFLYLIIASAAIVGVEYSVEFLSQVNLSISGEFFRVARLEGVMLPIGVLGIGAVLLYDTQVYRRLFSIVALMPIGLALVLTVGRGLWISLGVGIMVLSVLAILDSRRTASKVVQLIRVLGIPLVILGTAYFFQQQTGAGVSDIAVRRISRAATRYDEDHSVSGRIITYITALNEIRKRPVLGGGHGATVLVASYENPNIAVPLGAVDSLYLTVGMRMGIVGVVIFLWLFLFAMWRAYRVFQRSQDPQIRLFCVAFISIYAMMLVYGLVDATMFANRLIFIHATFLGLIARLDQADKRNGLVND